MSISANHERVSPGAGGEQWVLGEETRSAAGQSDPVGTSLQLTDCDRMTFEFPVTEWWRKTWPSGCSVAVAAAASHGIMEVSFALKWKDTSRQMSTLLSLCSLILPLLSALGAGWKVTFLWMLSLHGARKFWDTSCDAWKKCSTVQLPRTNQINYPFIYFYELILRMCSCVIDYLTSHNPNPTGSALMLRRLNTACSTIQDKQMILRGKTRL